MACGMICCHGVSKRFGAVRAVDDAQLCVEKGEFVALLGPSGCGKSTVLRLVAGLTEPTRGRVVWPGSGAADHRGEIGFVFQDPTLMPWANVADNVWLPLRLRGVSRHDARESIAESLALVGLSDFAKAYPRELSGGMRMRVSLARSLTLEPELFLFDEPFGALDEITRERLNDELLQLYLTQRFTALFVTHSVAEAVYMSTRVVVMSARPGRILADFAVPFGYPRSPRLRFEERYVRLAGQVSARLRGGG